MIYKGRECGLRQRRGGVTLRRGDGKREEIQDTRKENRFNECYI
jgi:hypothetical protein